MPFILPIRAALLLCFRDLQCLSRQSECVELLLAAGLRDEARLLYDAMFIQTGFSPDQVAAQNEIAARTRLWGDAAWDATRPGDMLAQDGLAARQIQRLLGAKNDPAPDASAQVPELSGFAELCAQLCRTLRMPPGPGATIQLAGLLSWFDLHVMEHGAFDAEANVGAPLPVLAQGLAFNALRAFISAHRGFIEGATGSVGMFHEAAHLDPAGLGPYLNGSSSLAAGPSEGRRAVAQLLRGDPRSLEQRGMILSLGLRGAALADLVDTLAEAGASAAIRAIFERAQTAGGTERDIVLLEHIRAAAYRCEDLDLALQAQRLIIETRPDSAGAWITLGDLQALAGNGAQAQAAFARSLRFDHHNPQARHRLDALRDGRTGVFMAGRHQAADRSRSSEHLVRRALLRLALAPSIFQDQVDCAELAAAAGFAKAARTLYDVVFITSGFSRSAIAWQSEVERRLSLWDKPAKPAGGMVTAAGSLSARLAQDQLVSLIAELGRSLQPMPQSLPLKGDVINTVPRGGRAHETVAPASEDDFHGGCVRLKLALRQAPSSQSSIDLRGALTWLERHVLGRPSVPAESYCTLDTHKLAAALAFNILREFVFATRDIANGPFGSAELFHAAARLEEGGLGPIFGQCADRFAGTRDMFGFIQLASRKARTADSPRDALERWSVLLSSGFDSAALHRLVDELADCGLLRAIRAIFRRACEQSAARFNPALMWAIRDAGLDHGDFDLASKAQHVVIGWRPHDSVEWIVLGEIEATAGNTRAAQTALQFALTLDAGNHVARERLNALEAGDFERFRITAGYGTNAERKRLRQGALQAA